MPRSYDVIVVGGGLIGLAVAYGLVSRRLQVAVVDQGEGAFRAAAGNFGLVWVQSKGATFRPYAQLSRRSAALWRMFGAELRDASGIDIGLREGGFTLCLSPEELSARRELMRHQFETDLPVADAYEMLDRKALLEALPDIGPSVAGASYSRLDASINPLSLLRALLLSFRRQGGTYLPGSPVTGIDRSEGGFSLAAGDQRVSGAKLVLAAGLGNAALAPLAGMTLPIAPLRGQMLITEKQPPWLDTATHIVRQMPEGGVLIGDSQEDAGYDDGTTLGVVGNIAARAVTSFPRLASANVLRTWGCLRVMTPDGFPLYEQSKSHPGAFAFAVHSGVTLAALHATELAESVAAGRLAGQLAPFSGDRFALSQPDRHAA